MYTGGWTKLIFITIADKVKRTIYLCRIVLQGRTVLPSSNLEIDVHSTKD